MFKIPPPPPPPTDDTAPVYVSIVFALTTVVTIGFLFKALQGRGVSGWAAKAVYFAVPLWLVLQGWLAMSGFYQVTDTVPPRLILFGILPAVLLIAGLLIFARDFVDQMPLATLTLLHVVRLPVELVLVWLFDAGLVPEMMTVGGRNLDFLSGLFGLMLGLAVIARHPDIKRRQLIIFNIFGLLLLANIVSIAALSLPSPIQQLNFDSPNRGVLFFPYIWLPTIIVPIVLFAHLAALWQLVTKRT